MGTKHLQQSKVTDSSVHVIKVFVYMVTLALMRLISPASRLFVLTFIRSGNNNNNNRSEIKALHHWPFVLRITGNQANNAEMYPCRDVTMTKLAQVMACCLTAPSHYLNQCWFDGLPMIMMMHLCLARFWPASIICHDVLWQYHLLPISCQCNDFVYSVFIR